MSTSLTKHKLQHLNPNQQGHLKCCQHLVTRAIAGQIGLNLSLNVCINAQGYFLHISWSSAKSRSWNGLILRNLKTNEISKENNISILITAVS